MEHQPQKSKNYDNPLWVTTRKRMAIKREHVITGREERQCKDHGSFEAVQWSLVPMVQPQAGKPIPDILKPFWSQCPTCDAAMQSEADALDAEIQTGETLKAKLHRQAVQFANIPPRHSGSTVWNWQHGIEQQRVCWDWARDYINQFDLALESGRSAVFCGSPGTGKTHLSIGMLRHVIEKGGTGRYYTMADLLSRFKDTYSDKARETERDVMDDLTKVDFLVIDEVGKNLDSTYDRSQFFRVLDTRYNHRKPVVLVTNLPRNKVAEFLGEPVIDRLREAGGKFLPFDWVSQRSSKKKSEGEQ